MLAVFGDVIEKWRSRTRKCREKETCSLCRNERTAHPKTINRGWYQPEALNHDGTLLPAETIKAQVLLRRFADYLLPTAG